MPTPEPPSPSLPAAPAAKPPPSRDDVLRLRDAMEKRDRIAAKAARIADREAQVVAQIAATQAEKEAARQEVAHLAFVLKNAQERLAEVEAGAAGSGTVSPQTPPPTPSLPSPEEARRHLCAAQTAHETMEHEIAVLARDIQLLQEELDALLRQRTEIRREQSAGHEEVETLARSLRIFTPEALADALAATPPGAATDGGATPQEARVDIL